MAGTRAGKVDGLRSWEENGELAWKNGDDKKAGRNGKDAGQRKALTEEKWRQNGDGGDSAHSYSPIKGTY